MTQRILLIGATGYVGGRLKSELEARGAKLRCLVRDPTRIVEAPAPGTEIVQGDLLDEESLHGAVKDVEVAYYLAHSMASQGDFEEDDRVAARNFARAAARAGVRKIVYLGGLGSGDELSPHLRSRHEVGQVLCSTGVPLIELRASIVLGSGSLSFEMIRALTERLPVMITPRWVEVEAQPIGIDDLLAYLLEAIELPEQSRVFEIGGADRVSYGDIMREYSRQRGLRRTMIRVPVLTPRLSGLWLGLVTPLYARIGRALVESIRHPTVVTDGTALEAFRVRPVGVSEAVSRALASEAKHPESVQAPGTRLVDSRSTFVNVAPREAFRPIQRIGGRVGWYACDWLWRLRGLLDRLVGGVGMKRGRIRADEIRVGDALDCWRVVEFVAGRRLLLEAEMKLPGRAWLEFEVRPDEKGSRIRQTAIFDPRGLFGLAYWYGILPLHACVFRGMLRGVAVAAGGDRDQ